MKKITIFKPAKTALAISVALFSLSTLASVKDVTSSNLQADVNNLVSPQELSLDRYAGYTFRGKEIADLPRVIDQIWTGYLNSVNGGSITYNFPDGKKLTGLYNNPRYGFSAGYGLSGFSDAQKEAARSAIDLWDDLIAPSFVERGSKGADIQFSNSYDPGQAYAYYPEYDFTNAKGWKFFGDIFVATPEINWTNAWLTFGGYGKTALIHELGHAIGLSHPGAYNGAGATDYVSQAEYAQDSNQYTLMSYWGDEETSNQPFGGGAVDWTTGFYNYPHTPMVHDILAVQTAYGADPTTRTGDTVYGWNSNAGKAVYDFSQNMFPILTIYDAGGNDTIDMSGANVSVYINLNDGEYSSGAASVPSDDVINSRRQLISDAGGAVGDVAPGTSNFWQGLTTSNHEGFLAFETGVSGLAVTSHDNIAIAYGTVIENAIGSSQRDYLKGNEFANVLTGNEGDDVLEGQGGADTYLGGSGNDTFVFNLAESGDVISDFSTGEDIIDLTAIGASFTYIANSAFTSTAGELSYVDGKLKGDVDGDGVADLSIDLNGAVLAETDLAL
ncbi:M10 family metallopeptidase C-terminal domain-containing protein [Paraglaciecola sp.]|uniref:M10 family metallopeptidase C-terminal domain-containing protein n=1 Tax=Paraglaciecola sp. TaxID=1920173 RepID=UPI003EF39BE3